MRLRVKHAEISTHDQRTATAAAVLELLKESDPSLHSVLHRALAQSPDGVLSAMRNVLEPHVETLFLGLVSLEPGMYVTHGLRRIGFHFSR